MLERVAKRITSFFIAKRWIQASDSEISNYMLQCKLMRAGSIAVLLFIGALLESIVPTSLFLFCFMSARKRSGGYHAKTPLHCLLTSIAVEAILFKVFVPLLTPQIFFWSIGFLFFSITIFCLVGTVNHPALHLSRGEVAESKKRLICIAGFEALAVVLILVFFSTLRQWALYMALGLACAALSTIVAQIAGQAVKPSYDQ